MPTWDGFLLPVLRVLQDGRRVSARDLQDQVADCVGLINAQRDEVLQSGQLRFRNRIGWAASSLARAGAVSRPRRGSYTITETGCRLLAEHPRSLDEVHLRQIPAYRDHVPARRSDVASIRSSTRDESSTLDPVEQIDAGIARLRAEVAAQLLERLRAASPDFLHRQTLGHGGGLPLGSRDPKLRARGRGQRRLLATFS